MDNNLEKDNLSTQELMNILEEAARKKTGDPTFTLQCTENNVEKAAKKSNKGIADVAIALAEQFAGIPLNLSKTQDIAPSLADLLIEEWEKLVNYAISKKQKQVIRKARPLLHFVEDRIVSRL
jgi:hypothetical protein